MLSTALCGVVGTVWSTGVLAAEYDWTGFYVGAGVDLTSGVDKGDVAWSDPSSDIGAILAVPPIVGHSGTPIFDDGTIDDLPGALSGRSLDIDLGYNAEVDDFLFGIETSLTSSVGSVEGNYTEGGNVTYTSVTTSVTPFSVVTTPTTFFIPASTATITTSLTGTWVSQIAGRASIDWLSTIKGRVGLAADKTLLFATGGLAIGGVSGAAEGTFTVTSNATRTYHWSGSKSETRTGYVVGGGIEQALDNHWVLGASAEYFNLGDFTYTLTSDEENDTTGKVRQTIDGYNTRLAIKYRF